VRPNFRRVPRCGANAAKRDIWRASRKRVMLGACTATASLRGRRRRPSVLELHVDADPSAPDPARVARERRRGGNVTEADQPETPNEVVSPSIRAQLLATEHWSLLASRSTTQNELLVRIAIFLTLVSASVVSLALVGQATDFDGRRRVHPRPILDPASRRYAHAAPCLQRRRGGPGVCDRDEQTSGCYTELDPGIDRYFVASRHDDDRGIGQTYAYFPHGSEVLQPLASSMMFILVVDAVVAGVLAGLAANAADASGVVVAIAAAAASIAYFSVWSWHFLRRYGAFQREYDALFPHPGE
jgi:hypothetical protein